MEIIIHRINTIEGLKKIPKEFGVEIDLRAAGSEIIMHHEPFENGENFKDWLAGYQHGTLILNIKEAGIETEVLQLVRSHNIPSFFLLDVEFPYLYRASRAGEKNIAIRYSEEEPIALVEKYSGKVDWIWIDTFTQLPLGHDSAEKMKGFKTCLVCPERWGRPGDIPAYRQQMKQLGFTLDAVMTASPFINNWIQ